MRRLLLLVVLMEERRQKEEKKGKKSFWRWLALRFPHRRASKYDLAKAEKRWQTEAGSYRTFTDAPVSNVHPVAAEKQLERDVPGKDHIRSHYKIGPKLGQGGFGRDSLQGWT